MACLQSYGSKERVFVGESSSSRRTAFAEDSRAGYSRLFFSLLPFQSVACALSQVSDSGFLHDGLLSFI